MTVSEHAIVFLLQTVVAHNPKAARANQARELIVGMMDENDRAELKARDLADRQQGAFTQEEIAQLREYLIYESRYSHPSRHLSIDTDPSFGGQDAGIAGNGVATASALPGSLPGWVATKTSSDIEVPGA
jgi:hypothetical protein